MPTILRKNNKLLVVSNETGKYVDVFDPHLKKEFDLIYNKMHFSNQNPNMKTWSVVADIRFIEGFGATFASAANPISIPVYGWIIEPFIDGANYVKNVATPRLESKRIKYYRKYGIIK